MREWEGGKREKIGKRSRIFATALSFHRLLPKKSSARFLLVNEEK
jgi:hypothetical protein